MSEMETKVKRPEDLMIRAVIAQTVGAASTCWSELPGGVFDTERAMKLVDWLHAQLRPFLKEHTQGGDDDETAGT